MTVQEAYITFNDMVDENSMSNNIASDKSRFVTAFKQTSITFLEYCLKNKNSDATRMVGFLLKNQGINKVETSGDQVFYKLPEDYFDLVDLDVYATKDKCGKRRLWTTEIKADDRNSIFQNEGTKASYEWERTSFFQAQDRTLCVHKGDFELDDIVLWYYRYPRDIKIKGLVDENGDIMPQDVHPEFDDRAVNKILQIMARGYSANADDPNSYQIDKDRLFTHNI